MVKLKLANDWGTRYYVREDTGKRVQEIGSSVTVRWPNGCAEELHTASKESTELVSDHGHSYSVNCRYPVARKNLNGIMVFISLDQFDAVYL